MVTFTVFGCGTEPEVGRSLGDAIGVTVAIPFTGIFADGVAADNLSSSACLAIFSLVCCSNFSWAFFSSRCFCTIKNDIRAPSRMVMTKAITISTELVSGAPLPPFFEVENGV